MYSGMSQLNLQRSFLCRGLFDVARAYMRRSNDFRRRRRSCKGKRLTLTVPLTFSSEKRKSMLNRLDRSRSAPVFCKGQAPLAQVVPSAGAAIFGTVVEERGGMVLFT